LTLDFCQITGFCTFCTLVAANLGSFGLAASAELLERFFDFALNVFLTNWTLGTPCLRAARTTLAWTALTAGAAWTALTSGAAWTALTSGAAWTTLTKSALSWTADTGCASCGTPSA
jgi:hypothetical protein